jgi:uncharacterized surface protein with fasciclin (FAS1) repeats
MIKFTLHKLIIFSVCLLAFASCKDKLNDDHYKIKNASEDLITQINSMSDLSLFAGYITKTGYDKILSESKLFTVYAPTNSALQTIDPAIVNDAGLLKKFVANHICYQAYFTYTPDTPLDIQMLSGKFYRISKNVLRIDEASIIGADYACTNGVLQIISNIIPLKQNIWEYFTGNPSLAPEQAAFLSSYDVRLFDQENSPKIGVYEATGKDMYDSVWVIKNRYLAEVSDLSDEKAEYTFFMLTDKAFDDLFNRFRNYCLMGTDGLTDSTTMWAINNDLVFKGKYTNLPNSLVSIMGTTVPVNRSAIKGSFEASNGIVYIVDDCPITVAQKIIPIIIEGESSSRVYSRTDLFDPSTVNGTVPNINASGYLYLTVSKHNTPDFYIEYPVDKVYSIPYNIYWVAYSNASSLASQSLALVTDTVATFPKVKQTNTFTEVNLGSYSFSNYRSIKIRVLASSANDPIFLDYIKLVPVLP